MPTPLHQKITAPHLDDELSHEKRLKDEIAQLRDLAIIVSESDDAFVCEGAFARCEVDKAEVKLIDLTTGKVLRSEPFKSHLYAVHRALCWAVMGMAENRFGEMQ